MQLFGYEPEIKISFIITILNINYFTIKIIKKVVFFDYPLREKNFICYFDFIVKYTLHGRCNKDVYKLQYYSILFSDSTILIFLIFGINNNKINKTKTKEITKAIK